MNQEKLFTIGMWWRIFYGTLRILLGLVVLRIVGNSLIDVVTTLMSHELTEDPTDLLYVSFVHVLTNHPVYISYFIFWGLVDIFLSYNLLKHKLWSFPVSFVLISAFVLYEIIRLSYTHSLVLLLIILIDMAIFWLIWREYNNVLVSHQNENVAH